MSVRGRLVRAARPALERVEQRELLSGIAAALATSGPAAATAIDLLTRRLLAAQPAAVASGSIHADAGGGTGGVGGGGSSGGGGASGNGLTNNTSSPLFGAGTPTPNELAREAFRAVFSQGRYYTGPGRFSDQGTTYYYRGLGGSTTFLHGDFNMAVVTPTDPSAPFLGELVMQDKNTNSQAILGLTLTGNRADVDAQGRPTHLTYTADPNIYSGAFAVAAGQGTVDIRYGANKSTQVIVNGRVYTTGLTNPLVNSDLYARHGRPVRFYGR